MTVLCLILTTLKKVWLQFSDKFVDQSTRYELPGHWFAEFAAGKVILMPPLKQPGVGLQLNHHAVDQQLPETAQSI